MHRKLVLVPLEDRRSRVAAASGIEVFLPGDLGRPSLERFISETYARMFGARIEHFAHRLIGMRDCDGKWLAGVGYTIAHEQALFLEQYLDRPIEIEIAARSPAAVSRGHVVEVGNLAACSPGSARSIIVRMAALLHSLEFAWVTFTSTKSLLNSFERLRIDLLPLAAADPNRLPDRGRNWGRYYETGPRVFAASIPAGFAQLHATRLLTRAA